MYITLKAITTLCFLRLNGVHNSTEIHLHFFFKRNISILIIKLNSIIKFTDLMFYHKTEYHLLTTFREAHKMQP